MNAYLLELASHEHSFVRFYASLVFASYSSAPVHDQKELILGSGDGVPGLMTETDTCVTTFSEVLKLREQSWEAWPCSVLWTCR